MKKFISIILILFASQNIFAQSGWVKVHPTASVNLTSGNLLKVTFINENTGIVISSDSKILKTIDGGNNWLLAGSFPERSFRNLSVNGNRIFVLCDASKLLVSNNMGVNWSVVDSGFPQDELNFLSFVSNSIGYLITSHWIPGIISGPMLRLLKTTDSGTSWFHVRDTLGPALSHTSLLNIKSDVKFFDENTGYVTAVGLRSTQNAGLSWFSYNPGSNYYFDKVAIINSSTAYASFYYQSGPPIYSSFNGLFKTTNAGLNWNSIYSRSSGSTSEFAYNSILEFTEHNAYMADYTGAFIKSTNSGSSFSVLQNMYPYLKIYDGDFVNDTVGFIVGDGGKIYKTTSGGMVVGINQTSSNTPDRYSLSQNYPNPLNPSTKINYEIKSLGFVSLKVFDLLGKEVATLVNEKQNAGSYVVDFNSTEFNLPSGIYFYTLNAGEFTETKKMVLIK